ncbi:DNA processing protein [Caulobacter ginsengisoli]|uniref:DNA processing protein n=1 Tax=Caulobacter ginsengisoli TaxID=400775 RepID=A0ABU0IQ27_9CAUL|nr:DNA-processing protein DprA [Caulobacter ginsengisoli]MDQ0464105.1 DNA processing protein [Caulobacter ginsengisoli]
MRRSLTDDQRRDWLRLARTETIGAVAFDQLIARHGDAGKALEALPALARRAGRAAPLGTPSPAHIEAELEAGRRLGARLIACVEPGFPHLLAVLDPPPPLIWALGRAELLERPGIAIVGARIASAAGQRFARDLARDLGAAGRLVVSGMARGIDAAAHEGSLATGAVAVLGGGVGDVYPPENRGLYERLAVEGCVVSECPPSYRAQARDFPRRNRIISGLSRAVVVVEAELKSGSLITARLAAEQGRDVLAVPGSPLDPRSRGTNNLLRQGAAICEGADDVLRLLDTLPGLGESERDPPAPFADEPSRALRDQLEGLLSPTPVTRDELVRVTGAPVGEVMAALLELSLAGRAELMPGGLVVSG